MEIFRYFAEDECLQSPVEGAHPNWNQLINLPANHAYEKLFEWLSLPINAPVRKEVRQPGMWILQPKKKRYKNKVSHFRFLVRIQEDRFWLFYACVAVNWGPPIYQKILCKMGRFSNSIYCEPMNHPYCIIAEGEGIQDMLEEMKGEREPDELLPFLPLGNGDMLLWRNDDFETLWFFNHEQADIRRMSQSFSDWYLHSFIEGRNNSLIRSVFD